jgi:serine/threonine-protein kinase RsbW
MNVMTEHETDAHLCVVRVQGEIDASTAPDLRSELESAFHRGCINIVLDLGKVSYADSSALATIVVMNRLLQPKGGRLVLAGASRNVTRILELSGLVGAAPTVSAAPDVDDALAGLTLAAPAEAPLWTRAVEVPASSASLARMRTEVCDMLESLEIPEATQFDIRVAVGEALSNAVRHGSPKGEHDPVGITVTAYSDRVVLTVLDRGEGFDGQPASDGDPYAASGRGVMFMRALMDHVTFERLSSGGTAVTLVKHITRPK